MDNDLHFVIGDCKYRFIIHSKQVLYGEGRGTYNIILYNI